MSHNNDNEKIRQMARRKIAEEEREYGHGPQSQITEDPWASAKKIFPRVDFPWGALPDSIASSLQQLARACATSPTPLPGTAFCLLSSLLGRSVSISPKAGWDEPLIFWIGDIRMSGEGKTPSARELTKILQDAQAKEYERYRIEMTAYQAIPKKEREAKDPPGKVRGFFISDLTIEGLRDDLEDHPTGGIVIIQDELSAFLNGHNQYKSGKGTDREAWLSLYDGKAARVVRKDRSVFITGARVSIFGGIQPGVFSKAFKGEEGLYLVDGTIFRFLLTYEPSKFFELTSEAWADESRHVWEYMLGGVLAWTDRQPKTESGVATTRIMLSGEAQTAFLDWRNELESSKKSLPEALRGFLPKAYGYALRLAGVIHCMHAFVVGEEPRLFLSESDIERGIRSIEFYLGHAVDALQLWAHLQKGGKSCCSPAGLI